MIEMNKEIVQYVCFYVFDFAILVVLMFFLCLGVRESKRKHQSLNEEKEYYWHKNIRSSKKLEEDNCLVGSRFFMAGGVILAVSLILIGLVYGAELIDMESFNLDSPNQIFFSVIGLLVSILTGLGLVLANKKKFYLGIDAQDVVKNSYIPGAMANMYVAVVYLVIGYIFCTINFQGELEAIADLAKIFVISAAGWAVVNLMVIIYQMMQICLNVGRRELSVFGCFRRRIIDVIKLEDSQEINANTVEKIAAYLFRNCLHWFAHPKYGIESMRGVRFCSILVDPHKQKCLKKLEIRVNMETLLGFVCFTVIGIFGALSEIFGVSSFLYAKIGIMVTIGAFLIIYMIGHIRKSWLLLFGPRYYFEFSYRKDDWGWIWYKVVAPTILPRKRFKAVSLIEDLLGFYKMLLYSECGRKYTKNVIEQVVSLIDAKNKKVCNTILLLLYYAEYENVFLKLENDRRQTSAGDIKAFFLDKSFVQKVNKKVKKKNVVNYVLLNRYIDFDRNTSVEYQLSNAILNHVYRESLIDNGQIVPKVLWNYRFESFFDHIIFCATEKTEQIDK